jgi:hypothetical protein
MNTPTSLSLALLTLLTVTSAPSKAADSPYTESAGRNAPAAVTREVDVVQKDGSIKKERRTVQPARDSYGNAAGNQYDLARDGAFKGNTIAVLHFYTGEGFDFEAPKKALGDKGFNVYRWLNKAPDPKELKDSLEKANQLWVISDCSATHLQKEHLDVIERYFESGHGVYIWGDNDPCYGDANLVGERLLGVRMSGNLMGDQPVGIQQNGTGPGVAKNHLISTGVETVYEGITVATIDNNTSLTPLIYGSAGNLIAAAYEKDGKRLIFDGGFTRLYYKWDSAGTPRYVKNAAAWLANHERFGKVVAK